MDHLIPRAWTRHLEPAVESVHFQSLKRFLARERDSGARIFPEEKHVFRAFSATTPETLRVVILGQDPYHGEGEATGLSFAVPNSLKKKPPSLRNILTELASDLGAAPPSGASDLTGWADQGVLLLNTILTVRANEPLSHRGKGWEEFTDSVLDCLNELPKPLIFVLWGAHAQSKKRLIGNPRHTILESPHPSPLSAYRGFFGSRVFSKINAELESAGKPAIDWLRISNN
jgi:uracil-DNA glycosylase